MRLLLAGAGGQLGRALGIEPIRCRRRLGAMLRPLRDHGEI